MSREQNRINLKRSLEKKGTEFKQKGGNSSFGKSKKVRSKLILIYVKGDKYISSDDVGGQRPPAGFRREAIVARHLEEIHARALHLEKQILIYSKDGLYLSSEDLQEIPLPAGFKKSALIAKSEEQDYVKTNNLTKCSIK